MMSNYVAYCEGFSARLGADIDWFYEYDDMAKIAHSLGRGHVSVPTPKMLTFKEFSIEFKKMTAK